jgi:phosphoglycerate dehydrogenase-like enzyme
MPKTTIVTCFPLADSEEKQIRQFAGDEFEVIAASQENIADEIFKADVFCGHAKIPVDWAKVVEADRLRWIQSTAAGLDHCLVPPVIESPILVSGCSGLFAPQVAEQTMALLTGLIRRIPVFLRAQQNKQYVRRPTDDLFGKSVGIVGLGGNGQRIAQVLKPMVGRIVATDCFPEACQELVDSGVVQEVLPDDKLEDILPHVDVVIVTLPLSEANENRFSERQFQLFQPGAYLINVGRGSVVDTDSLVRNLASGRLGGAGIDVVDPEPLPRESPLWEMDNVIISPHVGAQSPLRIPVTIDLFCSNLVRFNKGESLLNQVDKQLGFPLPEHRIKFEWKTPSCPGWHVRRSWILDNR